MATRLLLDTDIGTYFDDALCLAYLLQRDDCELVGITTVGGEADRRAMLAGAMCWSAGHGTPVFPGFDVPSGCAPQLANASQAASLLRWPRQEAMPPGRAIDFLSGVIRAYPHEVELLATGPLTNVAQLARRDPGCLRLLRGLTVMGGCFTDDRRRSEPYERNVSADPQAARRVYEGSVPRLRTVGLDVARRAVLPSSEAARRLRLELLGPIREWAADWLAAHDSVCFSDPLAAATVFDEQLCRFERGKVEVRDVDRTEGTENGGCRATTLFTPAPSGGPHEVALDVDPRQFFDGLWARLGTDESRTRGHGGPGTGRRG